MATADGPSTHLSLLRALVSAGDREGAWRTFLRRYEPLIYRWCRRWKLQHATAEDVSANVVVKLFHALQEYDPAQARFRSWLKAVVNNAVRDHFRHQQRHPGDQGSGDSAVRELLADVEAGGAAAALAEELDGRFDHDLQQAMAAVKGQVEERTWQAFWRRAYEGQAAADVATDLGMAAGAVYQAVYRVGRLIQVHYERLQHPPDTDQGNSP